MAQVGADRAVPVDVGGAGTGGPSRPADRPADALAGGPAEALLDLGDDLRHDLAGCRPARVGQEPRQLEQGGDEVDVGLHGRQQLRFEQQAPQLQPLDRVPLDDLHDRRGEEAPDVAEPAGHTGRGRAESATATGRPGPAMAVSPVVGRAGR